MVMCHRCDNEWYNDEHGLKCPQCQGEAVEIVGPHIPATEGTLTDLAMAQITPDSDPRSGDLPSFPDYDRFGSPSIPSHHQTPNPMNSHYSWGDPPDPDHEDIDLVSFSPAPGVHFGRFTSIRTGGSRGGQRAARNPADDVVGNLFQAFGEFLPGANNQSRPGGPPQARAAVFTSTPPFGPQNSFGAPRPPFSPPHSPNQGSRYRRSFHTPWPPPNAGVGRTTWSAGERIFPQDMPRGNGNANDPVTSIQAMMQALFAQIHGNGTGERGPAAGHQEAGGMPHVFGPFEFLRSMLDPANAVHGDVAMTQEALDRIISQMMEQNGGSSAPGPASAAAIAALPKKRVDKTMMGSDGKAECSVCMESVELGDEVTFLPCKHWFHELCVGIWLKEHDTCPHCRQSITPPGQSNPNTPSGSSTNNNERPMPRHPTTPAGSSPTTPQPGVTSTNPFGLRSHAGMVNAARMTPMPPQMQPQMQPLSHPQSPFTQPGMQQPYVPGGYPAYPEPQSYVQLPPQPPPSVQPVSSPAPAAASASASSSRNGRHHHSSRQSSSRGNDSGRDRAPSNSSGGGGVTGWFRSLGSRSNRNSDS